MSWDWQRIWGVFILVGVVSASVCYFSQSGYQTDDLEDILKIFTEKNQGIRQGRGHYPLPPSDQGQAELDHLQDLVQILQDAKMRPCPNTIDRLHALATNDQPSAKRSLFGRAVHLHKKRKGQDFIHSTSDQISRGRSLTIRTRIVASDPEEQLNALKEITAKINMVERAQHLLRQLIDTIEIFTSQCDQSTPAIDEALYFLPEAI